MARVKLDRSITNFVRQLAKNHKFGEGTMSSIVETAILFMSSKNEACFCCEFHKDQVSGLEFGRQQMALSAIKNHEPVAKTSGEWVVVGDHVLDKAKAIAKHYRRSTKCVIEQAVLEHLTRPPNCAPCQFYAEMCVKIKEDGVK